MSTAESAAGLQLPRRDPERELLTLERDGVATVAKDGQIHFLLSKERRVRPRSTLLSKEMVQLTKGNRPSSCSRKNEGVRPRSTSLSKEMVLCPLEPKWPYRGFGCIRPRNSDSPDEVCRFVRHN